MVISDMTLLISFISVCIAFVSLLSAFVSILFIIRKNKVDKLELLYDNIIAPSYNIFFRSSAFFICQMNLSEEDRKQIKRKETKQTDYIHLLNDINRYIVKFNNRDNFYKHLILLKKECERRLNKKWYTIYSREVAEKTKKELIDPLYNLYLVNYKKKYKCLIDNLDLRTEENKKGD